RLIIAPGAEQAVNWTSEIGRGSEARSWWPSPKAAALVLGWARPPPIGTPPVNVDDRVRNASRLPEVLNGSLAGVFGQAIVVDDDKAARRHAVIERSQSVHC